MIDSFTTSICGRDVLSLQENRRSVTDFPTLKTVQNGTIADTVWNTGSAMCLLCNWQGGS